MQCLQVCVEMCDVVCECEVRQNGWRCASEKREVSLNEGQQFKCFLGGLLLSPKTVFELGPLERASTVQNKLLDNL